MDNLLSQDKINFLCLITEFFITQLYFFSDELYLSKHKTLMISDIYVYAYHNKTVQCSA